MKPGDLVVLVEAVSKYDTTVPLTKTMGDNDSKTNPIVAELERGVIGVVLAEGVSNFGPETLCLFGDKFGWLMSDNVELVE